MKILITGASSGIGLLTALTLAARHHTVYITTHTIEECEKVKLLVKEMNLLDISVYKCDINSNQDIDKILKLDFNCLINNAALTTGGSVLNTDIKLIKNVYQTNIFSSFKLLQESYKKMLKNKNGRIIVMSSLTALAPIPFLGVYSSSKAAISSLFSSLYYECKLLPNNIKLSLIEPGMYHTGFNQYMISSILDDKIFNSYNKKIFNIESTIFKILEKNNLTSIVTKIIKAVEDDNPKKVYRAPFTHSLACRLYSLFK